MTTPNNKPLALIILDGWGYSQRSDGNAIALEVGDLKVAGVVLVGALSTHLPFAVETWEKALARNVPASWLEMNLAAFAAGREVGDR